MQLSKLDPFARDHHGVVTLPAAQRAGVSRSAWYRAVGSGTLELLHPNVARVVGSPATTLQRVMAAVFAAGPRAVASHATAAWLWGIPGPEPSLVDVIIPHRNRRPRATGVAIHRPRDQRDLTPVLRQRIPTSNILRTLCDLGALEPARVHGAVGHVITTRMARPDTLLRAVITHSRQGRPGVPALRLALQTWDMDGKPPDSVLEPAFRRLAARHRLPPVEFHAPIGGYVVDFLVVDTPVVIECDGWAAHVLDRPNWERDKIRDAALIALGYVVVHVTYRDILRRPGQTAERIRRALTRWAPEILGRDRPGNRDRSSPDGEMGRIFPRL